MTDLLAACRTPDISEKYLSHVSMGLQFWLTCIPRAFPGPAVLPCGSLQGSWRCRSRRTTFMCRSHSPLFHLAFKARYLQTHRKCAATKPANGTFPVSSWCYPLGSSDIRAYLVSSRRVMSFRTTDAEICYTAAHIRCALFLLLAQARCRSTFRSSAVLRRWITLLR